MTSKVGSAHFIAPQVLEGAYDEKCDIWSCGAVCYMLLCGYPPFHGDTDHAILAKVQKGQFEFGTDWADTNSDAVEFIKLMLTKDAGKRPSASELLQHCWLQSLGAAPQGKISKDLGQKLQRFNSFSMMKKLALSIISQQLEDDDIKELRECFHKLDGNKDGTLSLDEIREGMANASLDLPENLIEIISNLDTDGSGEIDYTEFIAATMTRTQYARQAVMWAAFRVLDSNQDGSITREDLEQAIKADDRQESRISRILAGINLDENDGVSFSEFCKTIEKDTATIVVNPRRSFIV